MDLHLFLGRSLDIVPISEKENVQEEALGKMPQSMIEEELSEIIMWHENCTDIVRLSILNISKNIMKPSHLNFHTFF